MPPDLLAAGLFALLDFLAVDFLAVDFLTADFLAAGLLAADFLAVDFLAVDLLAVDFLAVDLLAVDFLAVDFLAADFLAAGFFTAVLLAVVFLAAGFLLAADFFLATPVLFAEEALRAGLFRFLPDDDLFDDPEDADSYPSAWAVSSIMLISLREVRNNYRISSICTVKYKKQVKIAQAHFAGAAAICGRTDIFILSAVFKPYKYCT